MSIRQYMKTDIVTISSEATIQSAIDLMKKYSIRHLPVVDNSEFLGLVTQSDLRGLIIPSMYGEIDVRDVMVTDPITVRPDDAIEKAARLIYEHKIGALPVIADSMPVGILTVTDIVRAFVEMMGVLEESARLDVSLKDSPDAFEEVSRIIAENGGEVISVGMLDAKSNGKIYSFRLARKNVQSVIEHLEQSGHHIVATYD